MRPHRMPAVVALVTLCAAGLLLGACSGGKKPNSKRRTVLVTEYDDIRVGAEVAEQVAAQMGLYGDEHWDAYVSEIGRKLLRGLPRRAFEFRFHVVDQVEPNAFALPGGHIYISRGLLALAINEDELACVIGHEITHSAMRHAATQQALDRYNSPITMPWVRAATQAAYSRDMEREADRGGQMLCAAAGYDPMAMSTFLKRMGLMQRLLIGSRRPHFFDTHPGTKERAASNAARAREIRWKRDPRLGDTHGSYLRRIDGLPLGERPEAGVFVGNRFLHPDLDFQMRFPRGWRLTNSPSAVGAISPRRDAVVFLSADLPPGNLREVAQQFVEKERADGDAWIEILESKPIKLGSIDALRMKLQRQGRPSIIAYVTFFPYQGGTWRIQGMGPAHASEVAEAQSLATARSFRPLNEAERESVRAMRLKLVTANRGESVPKLSLRTRNVWDPTTTAVQNSIFSSHRFEGGELVKTAREGPYPAPQPN